MKRPRVSVREILEATIEARAQKIVEHLKWIPHVADARVWHGLFKRPGGKRRVFCLCGKVWFKGEETPNGFVVPIPLAIGPRSRGCEWVIDTLDERMASAELSVERLCRSARPRQLELFDG